MQCKNNTEVQYLFCYCSWHMHTHTWKQADTHTHANKDRKQMAVTTVKSSQVNFICIVPFKTELSQQCLNMFTQRDTHPNPHTHTHTYTLTHTTPHRVELFWVDCIMASILCYILGGNYCNFSKIAIISQCVMQNILHSSLICTTKQSSWNWALTV